jgi:hypothetical protein
LELVLGWCRLAFDTWAEECSRECRREDVAKARPAGLRVQLNGSAMAAWVGDDVIRDAQDQRR